MKKFILIGAILLLLGSCKAKRVPQERVVYKMVKDSTIIETTRDIVLPVRNVTIIDRPCLDGELIIKDQIITNEKSSIKISSQNGNLVVEQNVDSIVSVRVAELRLGIENEVIEKEVFVDKPIRDKFFWYLLIYGGLATLWIFKKPIMWLIRKGAGIPI